MGHDTQLREIESPRLDSWKEIASFLHRDARTVRRWERERRLPVHRVPGGERSGVFAYVSELESWLHSSSTVADVAIVEESKDDAAEVDALQDSGAEDTAQESQQAVPLSAFQSLNSVETAFAALAPAEGAVSSPYSAATHAQISSRIRSYQAISLVLLLTVAIGISAGVIHYREHKAVKTAVHHPNAEAQDLYLRGRYYWNLRTEDGLNSAVDLFTQSIVNDPHYAEAYAGLADAYLLLRQYGHMSNAEAYPRALAAAKQAIALDDASPDAHRSIAFILRFWNWDMTAAEKEYKRAIELNPNDSLSHHWYATALLASNRYPEALAQIDMARRLEPQSVSVMADRGLILSEMDPGAGMLALQQAVDAQPSFPSTHLYLAEADLKLGKYGDFLTESRSAAELSHNAPLIAVLEAAEKTLATKGPKPMLRQLAGDFGPLAQRGTVPAYTTARLYGLADEPGQAMRYLRMSYDHHEPNFLNVADDQAFAQLRSSAEYNSLIARRDVALGSTKEPIARLDTPKFLQ